MAHAPSTAETQPVLGRAAVLLSARCGFSTGFTELLTVEVVLRIVAHTAWLCQPVRTKSDLPSSDTRVHSLEAGRNNLIVHVAGILVRIACLEPTVRVGEELYAVIPARANRTASMSSDRPHTYGKAGGFECGRFVCVLRSMIYIHTSGCGLVAHVLVAICTEFLHRVLVVSKVNRVAHIEPDAIALA